MHSNTVGLNPCDDLNKGNNDNGYSGENPPEYIKNENYPENIKNENYPEYIKNENYPENIKDKYKNYDDAKADDEAARKKEEAVQDGGKTKIKRQEQ